MDDDGNGNEIYIRVVESVDTREESSREMVKGYFGSTVLQSAATLVSLDDEVPDGVTSAGDFINELRNIPSLHFV